jgi:large subunit ribosomal protein L22
MSKQPSSKRALADNQSLARARMLRVSPYKLNLLANLIKGKRVNIALSDLMFSRKRIAKDVHKVLLSAIANAENNHSLNIDNLIVKEAIVGKDLVLKRVTPRARGRAVAINKYFSNITIILNEVVKGV